MFKTSGYSLYNSPAASLWETPQSDMCHGNNCQQSNLFALVDLGRFRDFLLEIEIKYSNLLYYIAIRWFCSGKVLLRCFEHKEVIEIFQNEKNCPQILLSNNEWLWKLAFAIDIAEYLNEFNLKLPAKTVLKM